MKAFAKSIENDKWLHGELIYSNERLWYEINSEPIKADTILLESNVWTYYYEYDVFLLLKLGKFGILKLMGDETRIYLEDNTYISVTEEDEIIKKICLGNIYRNELDVTKFGFKLKEMISKFNYICPQCGNTMGRYEKICKKCGGFYPDHNNFIRREE